MKTKGLNTHEVQVSFYSGEKIEGTQTAAAVIEENQKQVMERGIIRRDIPGQPHGWTGGQEKKWQAGTSMMDVEDERIAKK